MAAVFYNLVSCSKTTDLKQACLSMHASVQLDQKRSLQFDRVINLHYNAKQLVADNQFDQVITHLVQGRHTSSCAPTIEGKTELARAIRDEEGNMNASISVTYGDPTVFNLTHVLLLLLLLQIGPLRTQPHC